MDRAGGMEMDGERRGGKGKAREGKKGGREEKGLLPR